MPVQIANLKQITVICCGQQSCRRKAAAALVKLGVNIHLCDLIAVPGGAGQLRPASLTTLAVGVRGELIPELGSLAGELLIWAEALRDALPAKIFIVITPDCGRYSGLGKDGAIKRQRWDADTLFLLLSSNGFDVEIVEAE